MNLLRQLNAQRIRKITEDAPAAFVPAKWRPYVFNSEDLIDRHYYELCALFELRNALRSGNIWLDSSRRYANPESYLIPRDQWPLLRSEVCRQLAVPVDAAKRLEERETEAEEMLSRVERMLPGNDKIRIERGNVVITPIAGQGKPESAEILGSMIDQRLPVVELGEILIETDRWTQFSQYFEHAGGSEPRNQEFLPHLYASLLAQGCNLGFSKIGQMTGLTYKRLAWYTNWYLREETLKSANDALVNFQYHQPLSRLWGGGVLSSSDGQRFPASGKVSNATALPRYFGYGKGVTFYSWTSDQFSQYGSRVIPTTVRDATYVLDAILDNETELQILEHTTDTAGYTELLFALFDLLGMMFSPRIRDIGDQQLYRIDRLQRYPNLATRIKGSINRGLILQHMDDILRVAGSLKLGWVTSSLLISKMRSYPRKSALVLAMQEYGRLIKTIFILRYLENEAYRRRIEVQLNKGEAIHALRRTLFFAHEGKIRRKQEEEQNNQALCLTLLTNAVIAWNTVYMQAVIEQLRTEGHPVQEQDLVHLSPARYEHINQYGRYRFELDVELNRNRLRPLRTPHAMFT